MCIGLVYNMLRKNSKQLVKALALSNPSRTMLTTGLFARNVIDSLEKLEISSESCPIKSADILVDYIVSRAAENKRHEAAVWKELETIEALNDLVEEMEKKGKQILRVCFIGHNYEFCVQFSIIICFNCKYNCTNSVFAIFLNFFSKFKEAKNRRAIIKSIETCQNIHFLHFFIHFCKG